MVFKFYIKRFFKKKLVYKFFGSVVFVVLFYLTFRLVSTLLLIYIFLFDFYFSVEDFTPFDEVAFLKLVFEVFEQLGICVFYLVKMLMLSFIALFGYPDDYYSGDVWWDVVCGLAFLGLLYYFYTILIKGSDSEVMYCAILVKKNSVIIEHEIKFLDLFRKFVEGERNNIVDEYLLNTLNNQKSSYLFREAIDKYIFEKRRLFDEVQENNLRFTVYKKGDYELKVPARIFFKLWIEPVDGKKYDLEVPFTFMSKKPTRRTPELLNFFFQDSSLKSFGKLSVETNNDLTNDAVKEQIRIIFKAVTLHEFFTDLEQRLEDSNITFYRKQYVQIKKDFIKDVLKIMSKNEFIITEAEKVEWDEIKKFMENHKKIINF